MASTQDERQLLRIMTSRNRLNEFKAMRAPEIILRNERRVLQDALRALRGSRHASRPISGAAQISPHAA